MTAHRVDPPATRPAMRPSANGGACVPKAPLVTKQHLNKERAVNVKETTNKFPIAYFYCCITTLLIETVLKVPSTVNKEKTSKHRQANITKIRHTPPELASHGGALSHHVSLLATASASRDQDWLSVTIKFR